MKATQRDLKRFIALYRALDPIRKLLQVPYLGSTASLGLGDTTYSDDVQDLTSPLLRLSLKQTEDDLAIFTKAENMVEPESWAALAYRSFMWWASAGELTTSSRQEEQQDLSFVRPLSEQVARLIRDDDDGVSLALDEVKSGVYTEIIRIFHNFTKMIIHHGVSACFTPATSGNPPGRTHYSDRGSTSSLDLRAESPGLRTRSGHGSSAEEEPLLAHEEQTGRSRSRSPTTIIRVSSGHVTQMGLDPWSGSDGEFVRRFLELWLGVRQAEVAGWEWCGLKAGG